MWWVLLDNPNLSALRGQSSMWSRGLHIQDLDFIWAWSTIMPQFWHWSCENGFPSLSELIQWGKHHAQPHSIILFPDNIVDECSKKRKQSRSSSFHFSKASAKRRILNSIYSISISEAQAWTWPQKGDVPFVAFAASPSSAIWKFSVWLKLRSPRKPMGRIRHICRTVYPFFVPLRPSKLLFAGAVNLYLTMLLFSYCGRTWITCSEEQLSFLLLRAELTESFDSKLSWSQWFKCQPHSNGKNFVLVT